MARAASEVAGPATAMDLLDLSNVGGLTLAPASRLNVLGLLTGPQPYFLVRNATNVAGSFRNLPDGAGLPPPNQTWFIHYGAHRIYLSQVAQPLVYFRAFSTNGVVVVAWRTAEEIETKSFNLLQWAGGDWLPVNREPIPAQNPAGAIYALVNPLAESNTTCRFRLVAVTGSGEEAFEYERTITEFAFSAPPRPVDGGVELRWFSRTDETYDLLSTPDLNLPLQTLASNRLATPPECIFVHETTNAQSYYRLRLVP